MFIKCPRCGVIYILSGREVKICPKCGRMKSLYKPISELEKCNRELKKRGAKWRWRI